MDLQQRRRRTRSLEVEVDGEAIRLEYRPAEVTADLVERCQKAERVARSGKGVGEAPSTVLAQGLARLISEWDVTDGGKPYPPTAANLMALDIPILGALFLAVMADCSPNPPGSPD